METKEYRILMVDDEQEYLDLNAVYFMRRGYNIKTMSNPIEALELLKMSNVDVLIVDYYMPEMTGEELIKNLRDLNKDIVIILQTGYAGQKPPKEMFEGITIQGYFNKEEGLEALELSLLSALRTAELMRIVKKNADERLLRKKKDEYFTKKISWITGDINEIAASMTGPLMVQEEIVKDSELKVEDKEKIEQRLGYFRECIDKIHTAMHALNIASQSEMTPKNMLNMINELLKTELWFKKIKVNLELSETACLLDMCEGILPYIICQDIENRASTDCKEINITETSADNNVIIKIQSEVEVDGEKKAELEKVASLCQNVQIIFDGNSTELKIRKL